MFNTTMFAERVVENNGSKWGTRHDFEPWGKHPVRHWNEGQGAIVCLQRCQRHLRSQLSQWSREVDIPVVFLRLRLRWSLDEGNTSEERPLVLSRPDITATRGRVFQQ